VLTTDLDTRSPTGRLTFAIIATMAQWERELILERTKQGLAAARARGKIGGAVQKIPDSTISEMMQRNSKGERIIPLSKEYGISRQIFYKRSKEIRDRRAAAKRALAMKIMGQVLRSEQVVLEEENG
jgi:DNA invertase Pin-like site-specific DNA recombinase